MLSRMMIRFLFCGTSGYNEITDSTPAVCLCRGATSSTRPHRIVYQDQYTTYDTTPKKNNKA
jgi:hypothetical protein